MLYQLLEARYVTLQPTSSRSTSSPSTFSSDRSAASFPSTSPSHTSSLSSLLHFVTLNSALPGSGLARRAMGGTGLAPFRPLREAGCRTRVGFSCRAECFSCRSSPEEDGSRGQFLGGVAGTQRSPEQTSCLASVSHQKTPFTMK